MKKIENVYPYGNEHRFMRRSRLPWYTLYQHHLRLGRDPLFQTNEEPPSEQLKEATSSQVVPPIAILTCRLCGQDRQLRDILVLS
jgi:hypothetical protein